MVYYWSLSPDSYFSQKAVAIEVSFYNTGFGNMKTKNFLMLPVTSQGILRVTRGGIWLFVSDGTLRRTTIF